MSWGRAESRQRCMWRLWSFSRPRNAPPSSLWRFGLSPRSNSSKSLSSLKAPASIHVMLLENSHRTWGGQIHELILFFKCEKYLKLTLEEFASKLSTPPPNPPTHTPPYPHSYPHSYLSPKAKRANSKLRDPVVLEEHALRLIGHSDRDGGEVLRLAAHSHWCRVAHAQMRARRCRTWLAEDQPHHQPEGETA